MKSISGVALYVKDINASIDFYTKLGFRTGTRDDWQMTFYLNWFWLDVRLDSEKAQTAGSTEVYIKVVSADDFYKTVTAQGFTPANEPHETRVGTREFTLNDPDGHQLVFYEKA